MIYLIPKGERVDQSLLKAVEQLSPAIQDYYKNQLGQTFRLNNPIIDTLQSSKYGYEYSSSSFDVLQSMEAEVSQKLESRLNEKQQVVLIFSPISFRGFVGVGSVYKKDGKDKRVAMIGGSACESLKTISSLERNLGLWTTAHELGHALGLSHNLMPNSLMLGAVDSTGYIPNVPRPSFPGCELTETDKIILRGSPFVH